MVLGDLVFADPARLHLHHHHCHQYNHHYHFISPHLLLVTLGAARGLVSDEEDLTELHRAELTPGKGHIH